MYGYCALGKLALLSTPYAWIRQFIQTGGDHKEHDEHQDNGYDGHHEPPPHATQERILVLRPIDGDANGRVT